MLILDNRKPLFNCKTCKRIFYNPKQRFNCSPEEQINGLPKYKVLCPLCGAKIYSITFIEKPTKT